MALLIKRGRSKLLVFNIYLPPTVRQADTKAQWGMLENYITCMETKFPVRHILRGVPPSIEALYSQEILQAIGHLMSARHSKDELTNFAGIQLALLAN
ncbi:hypothetical protein E2320_013707 [Naja naja]|nr:hypothetical protein E2320_013707 [Naja naja]